MNDIALHHGRQPCGRRSSKAAQQAVRVQLQFRIFHVSRRGATSAVRWPKDGDEACGHCTRLNAHNARASSLLQKNARFFAVSTASAPTLMALTSDCGHAKSCSRLCQTALKFSFRSPALRRYWPVGRARATQPLRAQAQGSVADILFWDKSGFLADAMHGETCAPCAKTPVFQRPGQCQAHGCEALTAEGG